MTGEVRAGTVLLLPSLGRAVADFELVSERLRAAGFDVVTTGCWTAADDTVDLHGVAKLIAAELAAAGHRRVHVVGHAFGQLLGRCLAHDHPDRVATLVMVCAGGELQIDRQIARSVEASYDPALSTAERLDHLRRAFFAPGNDASVWLGGWMPDIARRQLAAMQRTERGSWTDGGAQPVLVIQGADDVVAVPENGRRFVARHVERGGHGELVDLAGAGHALLPEQPDAVAGAIVEFLVGSGASIESRIQHPGFRNSDEGKGQAHGHRLA